jgi:hypothetical protein
MACITEVTTMDRAARAALNKSLYGDLLDKGDKATQEDRIKVIEKINKELYPLENRYVEIAVKDLPANLRRSLGLIEGDDMVQRYVGFLNRTTDLSKKQFVATKGAFKAREISLLKDNILKRDTGTLVHHALQAIVNSKLTEGKLGSIMTESGETLTLKEIASTFGLKESGQAVNLQEFVDNLLKSINQTQRLIDADGRAKVFTEAFIPDPLNDSAGTVDLLVIYSDGTADVYDYKTVYPFVSTNAKKNVQKNIRLVSNEDNVIPWYKMNDITIQLRANKDILIKNNIVKDVRRNRAIPINVNLQYDKTKPQGERLTKDINFIAIGENQDPALQMVPVDEKTGVKSIDLNIKKLRDMESNYEKKLEQASGEEIKKWSHRLKSVRKSINKIIMDKDMGTMIEEVQTLLRRYYDRVDGIKNINDPVVAGEPNPAFLPGSELSELISEFEAYRGILSSTHEFLVEIGQTDKKTIEEYLNKRDVLLGSISSALNSMISVNHERSINAEDLAKIEDVVKPTVWQKMIRVMSQQNHPVIQVFNKKIQTAWNKARLKTQEIHDKITGWDKVLDEYGKKAGLTRKQIYNKFIDPETRDLYRKYKGDLWKDLYTAMDGNQVAVLNKLLKLKDNAEELKARYRETYIGKSDPTKQELAAWDAKHNFSNAIKNRDIFKYYYEVRENPDYYTDGYKVINGDKTLFDFYNFYTSQMRANREMAGVGKYELIPDNFLPWIRQNVIDMIANGSLDVSGVREYASNIFKVKEDDQLQGVVSNRFVDPETGAFKREVPLFYTTPLSNVKGEIDKSMKSIDLLKSLYVFSHAVNEHAYLKNEVEPHVEALKDVIVREGQKIQNERGQDVKTKSGFMGRLFGKEQDWVSLFQQYVDYHLYGVKIQDVQKETAKVWSTLKSFQQKKELAFSVVAPAGNFVQIRGNAYFEGLKGYFYSPKHLSLVERMATGVLGKEQKDIYNALRYFFEPVSDAQNVRAKNLAMTAMQKWANWDTGFIGYRLAEHSLTENVMVAMMMNYGFDGDGNIKRLKNLPKGTKSLLDGVSFKDGKLYIEGFMDKDGNIDIDKYTTWRQRSIAVGREIKGGLTTQDLQTINMSMVGNLFMSFKNWMPGMIDARASQLRYDYALDAIVEGKYTALLTDMGLLDGKLDGNKAMFDTIVYGMLPSIGKLMLDFATFGSLFNWSTKYKVNSDRARAMFDAYKKKNTNNPDIQKMSFEDYLDYKQGQIRSLMAELLAIVSLIGGIAYMTSDDENEEARYKNTFAGRQTYRLMNRFKREIAFFLDFESMSRTVLRQPLPVMGLLEDAKRWSVNTRDELGDIIWGEETEREGVPAIMLGRNRNWRQDKPMFYETFRMTPGHKFFKYFELFERDKDMKY